MKLTETKTNLYKYTIDNVDFIFRIWEDDILAHHPKASCNVSFKYGNDPQYRYDTIMPPQTDKEFFNLWLESVSKMLAGIYNKPCKPVK